MDSPSRTSPGSAAAKTPLIAIADDDPAFATYLKTFLASRGYESQVYDHGEALLIAARQGVLPDVVLLDVMMPSMDGLATLKSLKAAHAGVQVIMLSGRDNVPTIVEALSLGAVNYVVKPNDPRGLGEIALEAAIKQALEKRQLVSEVAELRRQVDDDEAHAFLWGESEAMRTIASMVDRVADNDVTLLIRGESGVGKELVARAIHDRSQRRTKRFVKVNCAAMPDDLLESELFGHEKGAFTGAATLRVGKFEHADGGTLMLDEIGEMKASMQSKLLHVLQDGEFTRLGSNKRVDVDVRIIAATNRDLEALIQQSAFREDLYYRLKVIEIVVPPLRDRPDEILRLAEFFIARYSKRYNRPQPALTAELREALHEYPWPGNIRELENSIKRFVVLQDEALLSRDLRAGNHRSRPLTATTAQSSAPTPVAGISDDRSSGNAVDTGANDNDESDSGVSGSERPGSLAEVARVAMLQAERDLIVPTLRSVRWNRRKAAVLLGISYKTMLNKIKEHGIVQD